MYQNVSQCKLHQVHQGSAAKTKFVQMLVNCCSVPCNILCIGCWTISSACKFSLTYRKVEEILPLVLAKYCLTGQIIPLDFQGNFLQKTVGSKNEICAFCWHYLCTIYNYYLIKVYSALHLTVIANFENIQSSYCPVALLLFALFAKGYWFLSIENIWFCEL